MNWRTLAAAVAVSLTLWALLFALIHVSYDAYGIYRN